MDLQGIEVVSAKLFISYTGTNTAKDFKVGKKPESLWRRFSAGDDQSRFGGGGRPGEPRPNQLSLLPDQVWPVNLKF